MAFETGENPLWQSENPRIELTRADSIFLDVSSLSSPWKDLVNGRMMAIEWIIIWVNLSGDGSIDFKSSILVLFVFDITKQTKQK